MKVLERLLCVGETDGESCNNAEGERRGGGLLDSLFASSFGVSSMFCVVYLLLRVCTVWYFVFYCIVASIDGNDWCLCPPIGRNAVLLCPKSASRDVLNRPSPPFGMLLEHVQRMCKLVSLIYDHLLYVFYHSLFCPSSFFHLSSSLETCISLLLLPLSSRFGRTKWDDFSSSSFRARYSCFAPLFWCFGYHNRQATMSNR